jgi:predicted chitinase
MAVPLRHNGQMALVVNRVGLHNDDSELSYWLSRDPAELIAAVEIARQRIFGGQNGTRQGLQRVCRIIHQP